MRWSQLAYCEDGTFCGVSFSNGKQPFHSRKLPWTLILRRTDQSTPRAQVTDKHKSCDTSSRAARFCRSSAGDTALPLLLQSLERLSTPVSTIETKRHPQHPIHPANDPRVFWANTQHTQVIDFNSSCNLLNGQKKSKSIFTHPHLHTPSRHRHTHTSKQKLCFFKNRNDTAWLWG